MATTSISVDVYCHRNWDIGPVYRVYVDDEMLTERTWGWPSYEVFIKEHIEVDIEPGPHKVIIHNCSPDSNISFKNLIINGSPVLVSQHNEYRELSFTI